MPESIYDQVVGGKTQSSAPVENSFLKEVELARQEAQYKLSNKKSDIWTASEDVDRFRFREGFKGSNFDAGSPYVQERAIANETWGTAMSKGLDSFSDRFGATFTDYWKDYGRMGSALINWDINKMLPSESDMLDSYYKDKKQALKNAVFVAEGHEDDIFSKKFASEMIGNSGFALGSFAGLGVELLADAAITALTGGAGAVTFGASLTKIGTKMGFKEGSRTIAKDLAHGYSMGKQDVKAFAKGVDVSKQAKQAEEMVAATAKQSNLRGAMSELYNTMKEPIRDIVNSKGFAEAGFKAVKLTPLLGDVLKTGEKIVKGAESGFSAAKLIGVGAQGVRRMAQEINLASTEASFEGVSSFGDTLTQMMTTYKESHNGEVPSAEEYLKMKSLASKSAMSNYGTNMAILLTTNQIQFGNLFSKLNIQNKFVKELVGERAESLLGVNALSKGALNSAKVYTKGFAGTYGLLYSISKDFGKKQALWEFTKAFKKDMLKFQITEGLQENLQEVSASGWKDYYASKYTNANQTLEKAFGEGVASQFTKRGFNTFLSGAITGSIIHIPTVLSQKMIGKANEYSVNRKYSDNIKESPIYKAKEQVKQSVGILNDMFAQMQNKKFTHTAFNFVNQIDSAIGQTEEAAKNKHYEFNNHKDNALISATLTANNVGMIDTYIQSIKDMGVNMTAEDFESAFQIKLEDTKYSSVSEFTDSVAGKLSKYSKEIDRVRDSVKNMAEPDMYPKNSKERFEAAALRSAQEEIINIIALNKIKAISVVDRAKKVVSDFNSIPSLSNASPYLMRVLSSRKALMAEVGQIQQEIKTAEQSLSTEGLSKEQKEDLKEIISSKNKEIENLIKWDSFYKSRNEIQTGVKEEQATLDTVFAGVKTSEKVKELDKDGNVISESDAYDLNHEDIVKTFSSLVSIKNSQSGANINITEEEVRSGLSKIVDYFRLDQDTKDYISNVDVFANPKRFSAIHSRIASGFMKFHIFNALDNLEVNIKNGVDNILNDIIKNNGGVVTEDISEGLKFASSQIADIVRKTGLYEKLTIIANSDFANDKSDLVFDILSNLENLVSDEILKYAQRYDTTGNLVDDYIDEYKDFKKDGKVSESYMRFIANLISTNQELSIIQNEIYQKLKVDIDKYVIKNEEDAVGQEDDEQELDSNEDGDSNESIDNQEDESNGVEIIVEQNDSGKFDTVINNTPIAESETREQAEVNVKELTQLEKDLAFVKSKVPQEGDSVETNNSIILHQWQTMLDIHNEEAEREIGSIEEYFNLNKNKAKSMMRVAEIQLKKAGPNTIVTEPKAEPIVVLPVEKKDTFDTKTTTSGQANIIIGQLEIELDKRLKSIKENKTNSLQKIHDEIDLINKEIEKNPSKEKGLRLKQQDLYKEITRLESKKSDTFVSEESILDDIKKINNC